MKEKINVGIIEHFVETQQVADREVLSELNRGKTWRHATRPLLMLIPIIVGPIMFPPHPSVVIFMTVFGVLCIWTLIELYKTVRSERADWKLIKERARKLEASFNLKGSESRSREAIVAEIEMDLVRQARKILNVESIMRSLYEMTPTVEEHEMPRHREKLSRAIDDLDAMRKKIGADLDVAKECLGGIDGGKGLRRYYKLAKDAPR